MIKTMMTILMVMGFAASANAADKVYCVASAFSNDMPTEVAIFKTKNQHDAYFTECSDCSVKWQKYLSAKYDEYYEFASQLHGPYDSRSEAEEVAQEFEIDARQKWHQPFHKASFSCSGD